MEKLTLNLDETNLLEFETQLQGVTSEKIEVRYVIVKENIEYAFIGKYVDGVVSIDLPILSEMFVPKTYESKLTFIIEGQRYFEPMHVMTELVQPMNITTTIKQNKSTKVVNAPVVEAKDENIQISSIKVIPKKDLMERMEDALLLMKDVDSLSQVISIYKKDVLLNENHTVSNKDAIQFIDTYCKSKNGISLKEYLK